MKRQQKFFCEPFVVNQSNCRTTNNLFPPPPPTPKHTLSPSNKEGKTFNSQKRVISTLSPQNGLFIKFKNKNLVTWLSYLMATI